MIRALKASLLVAVAALALSASPALAQERLDTEIRSQLDVIGQDVWDRPSSTLNDRHLAEVIAEIIVIVLGFLGVIFVILIIYGGFRWMLSAGNDDEIAKAKKIISAAVIGVIIILAAYAITTFVVDTVLDAVTPP